MAEDLESRLFRTESTCLGRLTAETEHLPKKPRERHTDVHRGHMVEKNRGSHYGVMSYARTQNSEESAAFSFIIIFFFYYVFRLILLRHKVPFSRVTCIKYIHKTTRG